MSHNLKYSVLAERLAVCRLGASEPIPSWAMEGGFFCIARVPDELSIVVGENLVPANLLADVRVERGWIALKIEGPFPFSMTGVLAGFLLPLGEAQVPIFAVSTYDTDYVLIKHDQLDQAQTALAAAGHERIS